MHIRVLCVGFLFGVIAKNGHWEKWNVKESLVAILLTQNNGHTRQYRNNSVCIGCTERILTVIICGYSFVCLSCVAPVSMYYRVYSNSPYESTAKWNTCQIFKQDRLLVRV
jgi:hypothetical protein